MLQGLMLSWVLQDEVHRLKKRRKRVPQVRVNMQKGIVQGEDQPGTRSGLMGLICWCRNMGHRYVVWDMVETTREEHHKWIDSGS